MSATLLKVASVFSSDSFKSKHFSYLLVFCVLAVSDGKDGQKSPRYVMLQGQRDTESFKANSVMHWNTLRDLTFPNKDCNGISKYIWDLQVGILELIDHSSRSPVTERKI